MEKFAGLIFCGFDPLKFSWENFHSVLRLKYNASIQSSCIFMENFRCTYETVKTAKV